MSRSLERVSKIESLINLPDLPKPDANNSKKDFLEDASKIPLLSYKNQLKGVKTTIHSLKNLKKVRKEVAINYIDSKFKTKFENILAINKMTMLIDKYRFVLGQKNGNAELVSKASEYIHPLPDANILKLAKQILEQNKIDEPDLKDYSDQDLKWVFEKVLRNYELDKEGWKVVIEDTMNARASVMAGCKKISIKKDEVFSQNDIEKLVAHEINTHVLRAANGYNQIERYSKTMSTGFGNYIKTEEGLALYNEERNGLLSQNWLKIYAGRVLAVDLAFRDKKGFKEIFNELSKYFEPNLAYDITFRIKRGLIDTSKAGGFSKDAAYLEGFQEIKEYLGSIKDREEGMKLLYVGKFPLYMLSEIKEMVQNGELKPSKFLPNDNYSSLDYLTSP